jgi:8-oxo-dGTP diphosphatase
MPHTGADPLGLSALPIRTERLLLRPLRPDDAAAAEPLVAEREVVETTLTIPHPYPVGGAADWVRSSTASMADGRALTLAVVPHGGAGLIGVVAIDRREEAEGELGYWLGRPYWGQGYMTEAVGALIAHGFAWMALRSVMAAVMPHNVRSLRVLEKNGLVPAGEETRPAPARGGAVAMTLRRITAAAWAAANPTSTLLVAAVALVDADGRVLIARRPEGKAMAGLWEFPGGKVHDGETPEAALIRELQEELGIDTYESCLAPLSFASHRYETFHLLMPLYVCRKWQGTPVAKEGQTLKWVRPVRLGDYDMPPADVPLVAALRDLL